MTTIEIFQRSNNERYLSKVNESNDIEVNSAADVWDEVYNQPITIK